MRPWASGSSTSTRPSQRGIVNSAGTPYTPIVSVGITAPTAGFVLINATTSLFNNDPSGASFFRVSDGTTPAPYQEVYVGTGAGYQNEATVSTTYLFPVAAGAKTFRLEARGVSGTINAFKGEITALYVPFGATGGAATGMALPEPQPESDTPQNRR